MAKDTYYFSHDYNSRQDPKIKKLLRKHGMTGYGIWWSIVEDLYNNNNLMELDFETIAFDLRVDEALIKSVITDFELFEIYGKQFGSKSVEARILINAGNIPNLLIFNLDQLHETIR